MRRQPGSGETENDQGRMAHLTLPPCRHHGRHRQSVLALLPAEPRTPQAGLHTALSNVQDTPGPVPALALCCLCSQSVPMGPRRRREERDRHLPFLATGALCEEKQQATHVCCRKRPGASYCGLPLPVGHVVEVLCELGQIGALLLILLFCPK